jgi:two-component system cell cycle response regulator DivK
MASEQCILIVEDNPKNLKLIRDVLQFHGYTTLEAVTGEAGVEVARAQQPTLILMDVQLPGMNGREAMQVLKSDVHTRHIPLIALTAFAMKGDKESLLAEGFDGYIAKPVDIKEIPKVLEKYLSGRPGPMSSTLDSVPPSSACTG